MAQFHSLENWIIYIGTMRNRNSLIRERREAFRDGIMRKGKYNIMYFLLVFAFIISACGGISHKRLTLEKLYLVDNLLNEEKTDSASVIFSRIVSSDIADSEVRAMYNLISTHFNYLNYIKLENDSAIDFSISFFSKTGDINHLTDAWFYKAMTNYDRGNTAVTMEYLKKAEHVARELKDTVKLHKTIEKLSYVNSEEGEYEQALLYDKENLKLCRAYGNNNWTAFALMNLSVIYNRMGNTDSSTYYKRASKPYLKYVPKHHQALFWANEAYSYILQEPEKAEEVFLQALNIRPIVASYFGLAEIYLNRGESNKAEIMFQKAYDMEKGDHKIEVMKRWAAMHEKTGQSERFKQDMYKITELQDSLYEIRAKNNILNIQNEYDNRIQLQKENHNHQNKVILICIVAFIVGVVAVAIFVLINKDKKAKLANFRKQVAENQVLIEHYKNRMAELEEQSLNEKDDTEKEYRQKEIDNLNRQIKTLQKHQAEILHHGRNLYDGIKAGRTMSQWSKKDFEAFIEFYRIEDLAFIRRLEDEYDNLSAKNKAFEILLHEQYSQDEVQRIFGIGASTFRANKTRINAKRKPK